MSRLVCDLRSKRFIDCLYEPIETLERVADDLERDGQIVAAEELDRVIDHLESEQQFKMENGHED